MMAKCLNEKRPTLCIIYVLATITLYNVASYVQDH